MTIEEAANSYARVTDPEAHGIDFIREVFIAGAEWDREQMMKEAVKGTVRNIIIHENGDEAHYSITYPKGESRHSINDKVKIIIL